MTFNDRSYVRRILLLVAFVAGFLAAPPAIAASDETDWPNAFERAKRGSPGFAVESVEEFRKLTEHYASLLSDGVTLHSFELSNGDQIRCVEISSQRSLAASGHPLQLAPGTPPAESKVVTPNLPGTSADRRGAEFGLDGTRDAAGKERACPAQSFPKLMPRLENLYHFRRLEDLFQKTPGGGGGPSANSNSPVSPARDSLTAAVHEWAHAYQSASNIGMSADFNFWSPTVEQADEFSLSQLWVARGLTTDNSLQTVETGWQNCRLIYGDSSSHLFIFYTSSNYQIGTKCYNLDCPAFVQTDSTVIIGGVPLSVYSTQDGPQYHISLAYFRDLSPPHNWWLKFNDKWVGYYPNSLFDSQGIANYSDHIDFGGEIVNDQTGGLHTTAEMGSGRFPSEGFGHAAYTKKIQYWDTTNTQFNATGLIRVVTDVSYYDLSLESSTDSNWLRYFYFGGPGRVVLSCTAIALSPASLPNGTAGAAYGPVTLTPTSGTSPFTFSVAGLPSGLSRTSAASGPNVSIGGTPTSAFSGSVTVSGTDANTCPFSQVFSLTVNVNVAAPTANFTFSPNPGTVGQPIQFTDISTGSPSGWTWSFGDNSGSSLRNPIHTYAGSGPYAVTLTASNAFGASTKAQTITFTAPASGNVVKTIPIILDVAGRGGVRFSTELTLGNRGTTLATLQIAYTPATSLGALGGGTVPESLAAGRQLVIPDAIAYLRLRGLLIPTGSNQGGTLQISFSGLSSTDVAFAGARTTAPAGGGSAGLSYPAVRQDEGLVGDAYLYGLRETSTDRSNLALVNLNTSSSVALRITLFSGADSASQVLPDVILSAGQWSQLGSVLASAGFTSGYAKVQIVSGTGPYFAYAVFNDNATNDGSFVSPVSGTPAKEQQTLPVLVESPTFQSELVLSNPSAQPLTATLSYVESLMPSLGAGGAVAESLQAFEQKIIPNAIDYLRKKGVSIGASGQATFAGALTATFTSLGAPAWGFVGARTASQGDGGEYGLFYRALSVSEGASTDTWIFGLQQNAVTRSNVAVVNIGETGTAITVRFDVFDGDTRSFVGSATPNPLSAGAWTQLSAFLPGFGVSNGYVHVVRTSGTSHFAAYGVLNDGATSSSGRTNDGSYVASANR